MNDWLIALGVVAVVFNQWMSWLETRRLRREVASLTDSVKSYEMTIEDIYAQLDDLNFVVQP